MSSISATPLLVVRIKAEHARYRTTIEALTTQVFELAEVERREEADLDVLEARQEEASRTLASVKARLEVMKITIEERDKENKERREALLRNNARKRARGHSPGPERREVKALKTTLNDQGTDFVVAAGGGKRLTRSRSVVRIARALK